MFVDLSSPVQGSIAAHLVELPPPTILLHLRKVHDRGLLCDLLFQLFLAAARARRDRLVVRSASGKSKCWKGAKGIPRKGIGKKY